MKPESQTRKTAAANVHALGFGLFLGLCIWKFGNPVLLDQKIGIPGNWSEFIGDAWPTSWARWFLAPLAAWGILLIGPASANRESVSKFGLHGFGPRVFQWLCLLPLIWLGWQFVSASTTVDPSLTTPTLWQFAGCVTGYFLGMLLFSREQRVRWLLAGLLAAFAFCLVRAVDQRLFEFPVNYQMLVEGERSGWTNFPPATVAEMKSDGIIIATNGMDAANPVFLAKFAKGRVSGTLVYPNALAEIILLLWPVSLVLAFGATKSLRPLVRLAAIGLTCALGGAAFFWTGSKLGWLLGMALIGLVLLRLPWPKSWKYAAVTGVLILGLGGFTLRFHHYFATGATSAGARLDYWRAAIQTTIAHPFLGSGPGTFQRPYARLKAPESEMARLAHNDYLEQFSDSGVPGGLAYSAWVVLALVLVGRKLWPAKDPFAFALYLGVLGWFLQGLGEFGLYIPALAWTTFTLLGCLIGKNASK